MLLTSPRRYAVAIPDPSTFIGKRCFIVLKKGRRRVTHKVLSIDPDGVKVETEDGGTHVYQFSEIAIMNKIGKGD